MAAPSPQYIQQQVAITDGILSKLRIYRDVQRVRSHVIDVIKKFPSLQPRTGSLGTIPIVYNRATYNIPVSIWLQETYPLSPPTCFVNPVQGMVIKPKHRHVDSNGVVYLPYLSQWNNSHSNLLATVSAMQQVFGEDPPVRSQSSSQIQPPKPQPSQPPPSQPQQQQYPPPNYGGNPQYSPQPSQSHFEDPSVVMKRNAVANATKKMLSQLEPFYHKTVQEIDQEMVKSAELESKNAKLQQDIELAQSEKNQAESDLEGLTKGFEDLTLWLEKHDKDEELNIDDVTEPKDPLSKQLLDLVAEDAAIEDTLYYLERRLISGNLDLELFLKQIRSLSSEQFLKRATIRKIHERQRAARV